MVSSLFIKIVPTIKEHIAILGDNLREADLKEVMSIGLPLRKILWRTWKAAFFCKTAFVNGELAAVWGIGGAVLGNSVTPWLLTTPACEKISPLRFVRIYQREILEMLSLYPSLVNYVHADYNKAVRLLENSGFTLGDTESNGFRRFEMRAA